MFIELPSPRGIPGRKSAPATTPVEWRQHLELPSLASHLADLEPRNEGSSNGVKVAHEAVQMMRQHVSLPPFTMRGFPPHLPRLDSAPAVPIGDYSPYASYTPLPPQTLTHLYHASRTQLPSSPGYAPFRTMSPFLTENLAYPSPMSFSTIRPPSENRNVTYGYLESRDPGRRSVDLMLSLGLPSPWESLVSGPLTLSGREKAEKHWE